MWDRFLRACRREPVDATPVWFMRQAGRYMEEYRALRKQYTLLELCKNPELATEVTLQPVRALGVDAAILFADILLPLEPMGAPFEFAAGEGPVIHEPVRDKAGVDRLRLFAPEEGLGYVLSAIRLIRKELDGKTPLIGFAGAPFTLASYLIEGGGRSKEYATTKRLMYREPAVWHALMEKLAEVQRRYLLAQVEAGAQAIQLFDSWIGALSPDDYVEYIQRHVRHILSAVEKTGVPVIHFGTGTAMLLELQKQAGGTVIGIDAKTPLDLARKRLGDDVAVQGNLDNLLLDAPRELLAARVRDVLRRGGGRGHIFNLGHGILPETNPDAVKFVVDLVHAQGQAPAGAA
ncbi:MAG TPA: uroporphyrinogen decarboxylase [Polyangiaceae bacterium]|nr:uroporphyrinogen decarboxylase [Polyangiaceae bacterium]